MSDQTTTTTTTTKAEAPNTTEVDEGPLSWTERVKAEAREAGELGKAQWKDAFARTRKLVGEARINGRAELEKAASRVKGEVGQAAERIKTELGQAWSKVPVAKAQARGAALLLRVVTPVRSLATSVEHSLEEARAERPAEAPGQAATT